MTQGPRDIVDALRAANAVLVGIPEPTPRITAALALIDAEIEKLESAIARFSDNPISEIRDESGTPLPKAR